MHVERSDPPSDLITTMQAAKIAKVSACSLYRWIVSGKLRAWRLIGRLRVSEAEVRALLQPVEPKQRPQWAETIRQKRRREKQTEAVLRAGGWVKSGEDNGGQGGGENL
jgi:excisionase family DNA binding protein